jgi:two-component system cell cycle sensor histidine kinase/response regulator CckA
MLPDRPLRILVVDDDYIDREIYKQCLSEFSTPSFQIAEAVSGAAGIALTQSFQPDCILLDYNLPDQTGLDVLAHFNPHGPAAAVVMLTACGGEELAVRAMKAGVSDYLPKRQVNPGSLLHVVTNAVQRFQLQRALEENRQALERSERRYENLLEAMPQMVWMADAEGVVQYANRRWLEYMGVRPEDAARLRWDEAIHPRDREHTSQVWREATSESRTFFEVEHRVCRASDHAYRWHLVRAVAVKDGGGEVINWFGTSTEIENQKQAEKATLEREKLEGLGLLAGGIAHDYNNLLVTILGGASFAMETLPATHAARPILQDVICASERAAELTRKMLAYSGRGMFFIERIDLDQLLRQTCARLRPSLPRNVRLVYQGCRYLPPVETDAEQTGRIVSELVMNAIEAIGNESGTITVRASLAEIEPEFARDGQIEAAVKSGAQFVAIDVEDTGCGMDEGTQARIFDPFFSTKFTGRGMGLSAVKGLLRSSGGAIRVRSKQGGGTVFRVVLPAVAAEEVKANGAH